MLHPAMSDLFFSHSHDEWGDLFRDKKTPPTMEQMEAVIRADAVEFVSLIEALGLSADPEELVADFFRRV